MHWPDTRATVCSLTSALGDRSPALSRRSSCGWERFSWGARGAGDLQPDQLSLPRTGQEGDQTQLLLPVRHCVEQRPDAVVPHLHLDLLPVALEHGAEPGLGEVGLQPAAALHTQSTEVRGEAAETVAVLHQSVPQYDRHLLLSRHHPQLQLQQPQLESIQQQFLPVVSLLLLLLLLLLQDETAVVQLSFTQVRQSCSQVTGRHLETEVEGDTERVLQDVSGLLQLQQHGVTECPDTRHSQDTARTQPSEVKV